MEKACYPTSSSLDVEDELQLSDDDVFMLPEHAVSESDDMSVSILSQCGNEELSSVVHTTA